MSATTAATAAPGAGTRTSADLATDELILNHPKFHELVGSRNRLGWSLTAVILFVYFGFILLVAFDKPLLATKVGGGTTSLGILLGLLVIVLAFVLTAIYVVRANGRFDDLTHDLVRETGS